MMLVTSNGRSWEVTEKQTELGDTGITVLGINGNSNERDGESVEFQKYQNTDNIHRKHGHIPMGRCSRLPGGSHCRRADLVRGLLCSHGRRLRQLVRALCA